MESSKHITVAVQKVENLINCYLVYTPQEETL